MLKLKERDESVKEEKHREENPKKSKKKIIAIVSIIVVLLLILLACSTVFGLVNMNSDKIVNGISIGNVDVSGKTKEEAKKILEEKINSKKTEDFKIKTNVKTEEDKDYTGVISFEQIKVNYNLDESIEQAYAIGRDSNVFVNNFNVLKTLIAKNAMDII